MRLLEASNADVTVVIHGVIPELPSFIQQPTAVTVGAGVSIDRILGTPFNHSERVESTPYLFEESTYRVVVTGAKLETRPHAILSFDYETATERHYTLRFRSAAGRVLLKLVGDAARTELQVEVFPRKLDYRQDYIAIVADLESMARGLAFAFFGEALGGGAGSDPSSVASNWAARSRQVCERVNQLAHMIAHSGGHRTVRKQNVIKPFRSIESSPAGLDRAKAVTRFGSSTRRYVQLASRRESLDVPLNRVVSTELASALQRIVRARSDVLDLRQHLGVDAPAAEHLLTDLDYSIKLLRDANNLEFVRAAGRASVADYTSLVAMGDGRYARLFGQLSLLRRNVSLCVDTRDISPERIWLLYEWWCYYKLAATFAKYLKPVRAPLIETGLRFGTISLKRGKESSVDFTHRGSGDLVHMQYNRSTLSRTVPQRPDACIEVSSVGGWYIFDSKYRLGYEQEYIKRYRRPGPREEDINVAHRYRDAVLDSRYKRAVSGSYILFPLRPDKQFWSHKLFKSIKLVDVGGVPLLPGNTSILEYVVRRLLRKSLGRCVRDR